MKLQDDTHYLTALLDVRYIVANKISNNLFWSKHSLYNPNNIDNTEEVSEYGIRNDISPIGQDIILNSALCIQRDDEDYILLQNFEFVNYYKDILIQKATELDYGFRFIADKDTKQGCIRVKGENLNIHEFPILALITEDSCTIKDKLNNLIRCIQ